MNRTFVLRNDSLAQALWAFLRSNWKAMAEQGRPLSVSIGEHKTKRSLEQNKRLHAILTDISEQAWVDGRQYSRDIWKEYFRQKFLGTEEIALPGGKLIERGVSTTTLDVHEFNEFMAKVEAHAVSELGVELPL